MSKKKTRARIGGNSNPRPAVDNGEIAVLMKGKPVGIDPQMVEIVKALNRLPGLETWWSCEGHRNPKPGGLSWGRWRVYFQIEKTVAGWRTLQLLADTAGADGDGTCILRASSNGNSVVWWTLDGTTEECPPDRFATNLWIRYEYGDEDGYEPCRLCGDEPNGNSVLCRSCDAEAETRARERA